MNCNAEINYWPVEEANLSECHLPFMEMTRESAVDGAKTAQNLYHCRGWIVHHNIDLWRTTWPVDGCGCWAIYQVGSAWMCQHIWDHYQYTLDKAFLRSYYSLLRGATQFYLDNLQTDKDGYLVTNPSIAFENHYRKPDGTEGWACIGSAQDMQMIRSLFMNTMDAIDILGEDKEMKSTIGKALAKLAPIKVSPTTGRIQEWNEDLEPADLNNAEVSQGWGLVESNLISLRKTPDLAAAFRKTIDYRKPQIRYNSGSWTGAFPAMFWARLTEPDSTQKVVDRHFLKALYPNLTCSFFDSWQIDGNLGIASAIGEMLLQSQDGDIHLLPALPTSYQDGYVTGLKARGNYTVDIYWHRATLEKAVITSALGGKVIVRYKDKSQTLTFKPHERKSIAF
jgi:alpha-L-fucosidase 2